MPARFPDALWVELSAKLARAHRLSEAEAARLAANKTARLVAALPFLAGCEEAYRTALAHLAVFLLASSEATRRDFDHKAEDDREPLARLAPIADFRGGDKAIIAEGMRRLGLVLLNGYERDRAKDRASGDYNPLNAGAWSLEKIRASLGASRPTLGEPAAAELDAMLSEEEALDGIWED